MGRKRLSRRKMSAAIVLAIVVVVAFGTIAATDLDGDGVRGWDEWAKYNTGPIGPLIHNAALKHAIDLGVTDANLVKMLLPMEADGLDSGEGVFMDYVSGLDEFLQQKVVDSFLSDGKLSSDEAHQIEFLKTLPTAEQVQCIESGKFADLNWDGDTYTNYFEKFIADTPYDVKNEVYVIFSTSTNHNYYEVTEMYTFLIETAKIQEDHVLGLHSEDMTPESIHYSPSHYKTNMYGLNFKIVNPENLEAAIDAVSQKAGKNDIVLVILNGGGNVEIFAPKHSGEQVEPHVSYQWIDDRLNKIDSKAMIIPISACHSGSAIPYLEDTNKPRIILTSCSAEEEGGGIDYEFLMALKNKSADKDGNGYVSVGEAAEYAKRVGTYEKPGYEEIWAHPQISDINNLGPNLYLIELNV